MATRTLRQTAKRYWQHRQLMLFFFFNGWFRYWINNNSFNLSDGIVGIVEAYSYFKIIRILLFESFCCLWTLFQFRIQKRKEIRGKTLSYMYRHTHTRRISIAISNTITVIVNNNVPLFGNIFRCFSSLNVTSIQYFMKSSDEKNTQFQLDMNGKWEHGTSVQYGLLNFNRKSNVCVQFFAYSFFFFFLMELRVTLLCMFGFRVGGYVSEIWAKKNPDSNCVELTGKKSRICDLFWFEFNLHNKIFIIHQFEQRYHCYRFDSEFSASSYSWSSIH